MDLKRWLVDELDDTRGLYEVETPRPRDDYCAEVLVTVPIGLGPF